MQPSHMFNKRDTGSDEQCRQCHVVGYITSYNGHKYSLGTRVRLQHKADSRNCLLSGFLSLKGLPPQPSSAPYPTGLVREDPSSTTTQGCGLRNTSAIGATCMS